MDNVLLQHFLIIFFQSTDMAHKSFILVLNFLSTHSYHMSRVL